MGGEIKQMIPLILTKSTYAQMDISMMNDVKVSIMDESGILNLLRGSSIWWIDTETYGRGLDKDEIIEEYRVSHKVFRTENALKHWDKVRKEHATDPKRNKVRLLQIRVKGFILILDRYNDYDLMNDIMKEMPNIKVGAHNLKFDLASLITDYGREIIPKECYCTMIGHRLMMFQREVRKTNIKSSYKECVKLLNGVNLEKDSQTEDWSGEITAEMLKYAYLDVLYLPDLFVVQRNYIQSKSSNLLEIPFFNTVKDAVLKLEMEFLPVLTMMELEGIPIDQKALLSKADALKPEYEKAVKALGNLNPNSPKQMVEHLKKHGADWGGRKETSDEAFLLANLDIPLVKEVLECRSLRKLIGDIEKYAKNPTMYSSFSQVVGFTGRMGSSGENVQNVNRKIKNIYIRSDEEWSIMKADYPNIEARIASEIMEDSLIRQIFFNNEDMHVTTGQYVLGKKEITKDERQNAKAVNFGFLYGAGAKTFQAYAFKTFGLSITLDEAKEYRRKFMELYSGIKAHHKNNGNLINAFALKQRKNDSDKGWYEYEKNKVGKGYKQLININENLIIETLFGRRMAVNKFTDMNNFNVQGSGADMIKIASTEFHNRVNPDKARIINMVHDEIIVKYKRDYEEICKLILVQSMENIANELMPNFTTQVEVELITN